jgi:hypothetical protein
MGPWDSWLTKYWNPWAVVAAKNIFISPTISLISFMVEKPSEPWTLKNISLLLMQSKNLLILMIGHFFIWFYYYWLHKDHTPKHWPSLNFSASDKHSSLQSCNLSDKEITSIEITCCETFNSHNFQMGLISCRITPWQAFPAKSNVSGEPRSPP